MANAPEPTQSSADGEEFHMGSLLRMGSWGIGAAAALLLAVLAGMSNPGSVRVDGAVAAISGNVQQVVATPIPTAATHPSPVVDNQPSLETRRLSEQVRLLAADRDRLLQRLTVVEHSVEDITGSIKRQATAKPADVEAKPQTASTVTVAPPWPATPQVTAPWSSATAAAHPETPSSKAEVAEEKVPTPTPNSTQFANADPAAMPMPTPRPDADRVQETQQEAQKDEQNAQQKLEQKAAVPGGKRMASPAKPQPSTPQLQKPQAHQPQQRVALAGRPEPAPSHLAYGIDLGGAVSVDRLRMLWNAVRSSQTQTGILNGLHPVAAVRPSKDGDRPDIRLVVGPLPNEESASRLCSALLDSGRYCEPTMYRGQRMSGR